MNQLLLSSIDSDLLTIKEKYLRIILYRFIILDKPIDNMATFEEAYNKTFSKAIVGKCECNKNLEKYISNYKNCSQKIGFTLTFDTSYHNEDSDILYEYVKEYVKKHFLSYPHLVATEFTTSGVMHFHGVFYNLYQRCVVKILRQWKKTYGFIKIEYTITPKWEQYIIKESDKIGYPCIHNLNIYNL